MKDSCSFRKARLTITAHPGFDEVLTPDVLAVAGGLAAVKLATPDSPIVQWIRSVHPATTWTTSVCTGALLLGAAGVLQGRRATTHWHFVDLLRDHGATPTEERVVLDGNVITAAGVSAGIDMALGLAARFREQRCRRRPPW